MPKKMQDRPGLLTTEFWFGLVIPQVIGFSLSTGVITPDMATIISDTNVSIGGDASIIVASIQSAVETISGAAISIVTAWKYMRERLSLKRQKVALAAKE